MLMDTYLLYLAAVAVFFATPPGTSQLLIISNSIRHGLKRSLWTIAGDLSANCLQMAGAAFGLAAIIATSASAFLWIKWLGVAYLAWIGLQLILAKEGDDAQMRASGSGSAVCLYRQGLVTSMANPFAVVFFLIAWGWLSIRAANGLKRVSLGLVNKVCGSLMIAAAALLASKDFEPQK